MRWPTMRAMMSLGPPAGNGTISFIGLDGNSCAVASAGRRKSVSPVSSLPMILIEASPDGSRSTVEYLHRRFVHPRIAGRDDAAAVLRGLAIPGGDDAAGAGDDRDQGRDIVGLQLGLDHEVEVAGRQHAVGV